MVFVMAKTPVVPFAHQPPKITILSDHASQDRCEQEMANDAAATLADKDRLNLEKRLASTFDILRHKNTRCPLAVAVYGDWGTGKTSAMRWLETRLHEWNKLDNPKRQGHPRAYPVWFDPWRYHSKEEVWRGIIAEVILSLFRVNHLNHENALPRMVQAVKKFGGFLGRSFIHAMANLEIEAGGKAKLPGIAEGEVKFTAKGEMFRDIWEEYEKAAQPQKAHLNHFEDTLRTWVTDFLGPQAPSDKKATHVTREPARLVLFIDDLDRCLPEVTLEVIEALKLYLNIDHLIFVVGLDETVVRSVVAEHYKKAGVDAAKAGRYLDKIFQVDLRIPPSEAQMPGYMKTQIAALNEATGGYWQSIMERSGHRETLESVLISLARNNPREVKRLLNSALLRGRAASLDETLTGDEERTHLSSESSEIPESQQEKEATRFAQGVQLLLLQRLLADRLFQSEDLLTYRHHLKWFEEASRLLRVALKESELDLTKLLAYLPDLANAELVLIPSAKGFVNLQGKKTKPVNKKTLEACAALHRHLTENPPKADGALWLSPLFLQLLQVPFSQAVAEHFPPSRSPEAAAVKRPLDLDTLPDFVLEVLSRAVGVPVGELKLEHLAKITELSLQGTPITTQQLQQVLRGLSLEKLDLSYCTALENLPDLSAMQSLKSLDLSLCAGLKDHLALNGLLRLDQLETLSLRRCLELESLPDMSTMKSLKLLDLRRCTGLANKTGWEQRLPPGCEILEP
jgi:hypothetical protein